MQLAAHLATVVLLIVQALIVIAFGVLFVSALAASGFDKTIFTQIAGMVLVLIPTVALVGVSVCVVGLSRPRHEYRHAALPLFCGASLEPGPLSASTS